MSITALQVEALPDSGGASVRGWLNDIDAVLARAGRLDVSAGTDAALVEAARRTTGATSTAAWLRADGMSPGAAHREIRLAGALADHDATREAMQAGRINPEQAAVITDALDALSDQVIDRDKNETE